MIEEDEDEPVRAQGAGDFLDRPAVKEELERAAPKSKRSSFVEGAIANALREMAIQDALKAIREFRPYPLKGPGVVETLRQARAEWTSS